MGRLSRSSSQNSLGGNEPPNASIHAEGTRWTNERPTRANILGLGPIISESVKYTTEHPLGSILVNLAADNTYLAEQANLPGLRTNIHDLCSSFHNGMQLEQSRREEEIKKAHKNIEN